MGDLEAGLLEWSSNQAEWQRDLLRRLAAGEVLGSSDFRAYADAAGRVELAKEAPWFTEPELPDETRFEPLDASHLTATVVGGDPVQITKITHIDGANDLAPGAELDFTPTGLTIIAGKNGSGKSGYTRILKQVAATRASEAVLPNAFQPEVSPKAIVSYQVGTSTSQEFSWEAGATRAATPLQRARVFDSRSAVVHLAGATEVAYVPPTLQVLAEYTRVLQEVSTLLEADAQTLRYQERQWPSLSIGAGLEVFENLGEETGLAALRSFTGLTGDEEAELQIIPSKLRDLESSNPAALAIQARQRASQLTALAENLERVAFKLQPEEEARSKAIREAVQVAQTNSAEAQVAVASGGSLEGTGNEAWRELWAAAASFVAQDHPHDFPDLSKDSTCPLCQQRLSEDARERFRLYAEFMRGEALTALANALNLRSADTKALEELPLDTLITQSLVDLVGTYDESVAKKLLPLIGDATTLRDALLASQDSDDLDVDSAALHAGLCETALSLREFARRETETAETLAATDTSALAVATLTERQAALSVRKGLVLERDEIGTQHDRLVSIRRLEAAKATCATTSASRKNSDLSQNYVAKVSERFEVEAKSLGLGRVPVELVFDRTSRGVSYVRVSLKGAPRIAVSSVLSEGEQRVAAIAGFFADLTESGDSSTLIFDDPVSSLDQEYRVMVARRLLAEAERRQVLVFTHDFSFVQYLYEEKKTNDLRRQAASEAEAPDLNYLHIARVAAGAGVPTEAESWRHVSIPQRIGRLNARIQSAGVLYRNKDFVAYEKEARDVVGAIRETWEAFVEQDLLNGVVTRHDRRVQTQKLNKIVDLTAADIAAVELGMSVDSRYMTGHAAPISDGSAPQPPEWLASEVDALKVFRLSVLRRR